MLATMRPIQTYQSEPHGQSRSASRTSQYSSNNGSPSASPSRAPSNKSSTRNGSSTAKSNGSEKASTKTVAASSRPAKKNTPSSLSNEVEAVGQIKPGLITLSKPLDSGEERTSKGRGQGKGSAGDLTRGKQSQGVEEESLQAKPPKAQRKKKNGLVEDLKMSNSTGMLSQSAPASHKALQDDWEMPNVSKRGEDKAEVPLTWQQQLIQPSAAPTPEKKKATNTPTTKKSAGKKGAPTPTNESLTWQQELLGSNKPRGPAFDVFADARDEATFGASDLRSNGTNMNQQAKSRKHGAGGGGGGGGGRKRADSVGEMGLPSSQDKKYLSAGPPSAPLSSSKSGPSVIGLQSSTPSTPNTKFAYAGPNFHNSPSPASLPAPTFLRSKGGEMGKSPSTLFAREARMNGNAAVAGEVDEQSSNESGEDGEGEKDRKQDLMNRSFRGSTAPPQLQSDNDAGNGTRSVTIESLLAKMMRPISD
ncbi:hypothetical protein CBS101457_000361 [Exobasidium rhododendri]|nr:hypothetical protein CBS101457_000361 [Exobasidium rhododendri]